MVHITLVLFELSNDLLNQRDRGSLGAYPKRTTKRGRRTAPNCLEARSRLCHPGLGARLPDPAQNSALQGEIDQIMNQQPILQEQIAAQLAGTGTSLINAGATSANLYGNLYQALVQNDTTQAANAGKAIASLAAAMAGKSQATRSALRPSRSGNRWLTPQLKIRRRADSSLATWFHAENSPAGSDRTRGQAVRRAPAALTDQSAQ